jgi:hypothetical protein
MLDKHQLALRSYFYSLRRGYRTKRLNRRLQRLEGYHCVNTNALSRLVIFPNLKIGFNRIKKCANSSTLLHLAELDCGHDLSRTGDNLENIKSKILSDRLNIENHIDTIKKFDDLKWLVVVRNPYTRLLSCFLEKSNQAAIGNFNYTTIPGLDNRSREGFRTFVHYIADGALRDNGHWDLQINQCCFPKSTYNIIAKMESLRDDLSEALKHHQGQAGILAKSLKTGIHTSEAEEPIKVTRAKNHLTEFYDRELENLVSQIYEKDFETWGYSKEL